MRTRPVWWALILCIELLAVATLAIRHGIDWRSFVVAFGLGFGVSGFMASVWLYQNKVFDIVDSKRRGGTITFVHD